MNAQPESGTDAAALTVNDRLKRSFGSVLWVAMILATVFHFAVFALWPEQHVPVISTRSPDIKSLHLEDNVRIPPKPKPLGHPAKPVIATDAVDETLTIATTDFESYEVSELPEPPKDRGADVTGQPKFTPYTVGPSILNRDEVVKAMGRVYPPMLRDAGIGGTVTLFIYIDEHGLVKDHRIAHRSGHPQLDSAALEVLGVYRFSPALNRDQKTAVWVQFPIRFSVK